MSNMNNFNRIPNLRGQFTLCTEAQEALLDALSSTSTMTDSQNPFSQLLTGAIPRLNENERTTFGGLTIQLLKDCCCCNRNTAVAQCIECRDYMCQPCVRSHASLNYARNHHVQYLDDITKKVMTVSDAALQSFGAPAWPRTGADVQTDALKTEDLLDTVSKMEQLNVTEQKPQPISLIPICSRAVGAERQSSSSSPSSGNMSNQSGNNSMENLQSISRGRTPTDGTSGSDATLTASKPPSLPSTPLSSLASNRILSTSLCSNPSTAYSVSPPSASSLTQSPPGGSGESAITPTELFALYGTSPTVSAAAMALVPFSNSDLAMYLALRCPPCLRHKCPYLFFCTSCMLPACLMCRLYEHFNHNIINITDAIQNVKLMSSEIISQIRQTSLTMRQYLDCMQRMIEEVDIRAHFAASNVKHSFQKCPRYSETCKSGILVKLDHARHVKTEIISAHMETMRYYFMRLGQARDLIADLSKFMSPFELIIANHKAFRDLTQSRNVCRYVMSTPLGFDENSYFMPNKKCPSFGVSLSPFNPVKFFKDSRMVLIQEITMNPLQLSMLRCRPIFGCTEMVTVNHYGSYPTRVWGGPGEEEGKLCRPWGISCNRHGEVIVTDRSNNRIQVFNTMGGFLFEFGGFGTGPGQFHKCAGVAVGPHDEIVICDKDNHRVQVFTRFGEFMFTFGSEGEKNGQFRFPWDVAVDSFGNILISDTRNHRIQLFTSNGHFIAKWGGNKEPNVPRLFDTPRGVTFDPRGNIMVTDFNMHKVVLIERPSGRARKIGAEGRRLGDIFRPQGLCCDDRGWFVVVDSRNHRCQIFNEYGEALWAIGRQGKNEPGNFERPTGVCLDPNGHILIIDSENHRVQKY